MINTVKGAEQLALKLLADQPNRLRHVKGVAKHMAEWLAYVGESGKVYELHMQIAWLHDIGYSTLLNTEDFHAVDGFEYLKQQGWDYPVYMGVLIHSFSYDLAKYIKPQLQEVYVVQEQVDYIQRYPDFFKYITLVDLHTSPTGGFVTFEDRRTDILSRYGDSPVTWHIYEVADTLKAVAHETDFEGFAREMVQRN